jgi:hypothetical protein
VTLAPPEAKRASAGRSLMRGMMWLLAAFFMSVAGWIVGSLVWPGLMFIIGFPIVALVLWGAIWLVLSVAMYWLPTRGAR